jgi:hypothetical protein
LTTPLFDAKARALDTGTRKDFFILFVDAMFTTLLERLFTNAPDVIRANYVRDCMCRARHAD